MNKPADYLALADWRRQIASLYGRIRSAPDPKSAWRDWRETRDSLFDSHSQSPVPGKGRAGFGGLPYYDYDPALRLLAGLGPVQDQAAERLDLGADGAATLIPAARTVGLSGSLGGELTIYWISGYGGGVLLPFTDATSGDETYGGGRYLLDTIKGADLGMQDGKLLLDFNFAYHPSCVYSAAWTCPLAPPDNRLPNAVRGGERLNGPTR